MKKFKEAFISEFKTQPTSILEIGSRDGDHAEMLRAECEIDPTNVFIVEPHPLSFRNILVTHPEFRTFELAVSDAPGVLDFNAVPPVFNKHVVGTSSLLKVNPDKAHLYPPYNWVKVLAVTGQTILQLINRPEIDLVKIDVEGYSYEVLKSFGPDLRLLKALHIEVEVEPFQIWEGEHGYHEISAYLRSYGFKEMYYDGMFWGNLQGDNVWVRID